MSNPDHEWMMVEHLGVEPTERYHKVSSGVMSSSHTVALREHRGHHCLGQGTKLHEMDLQDLPGIVRVEMATGESHSRPPSDVLPVKVH